MIDRIENIICFGEGFSSAEIRAKSRIRVIMEIRQMIVYFAKENTNMTWGAIARHVGYSEHCNAIYAYKQISDLIDSNPAFRQKMILYEKKIKAIKLEKMADCAVDKLLDVIRRKTELANEILLLDQFIEEINSELKLINTKIQNLNK